MKKIMLFVALFVCGAVCFAGPRDGGRGGRGNGGYRPGPSLRHYDRGWSNGDRNLWRVGQIVNLVGDSLYIANQLNQPRVVYTTPVVQQPVVYQQPVVTTPVIQQPVVQYQQYAPQVIYQQPVVQPTVIVQPRRQFIVYRVLDAIFN